MMELIDRKALANEDPCEHCHYKGARCLYTCNEHGYGEHAIWRTIDDAPVVDAVPVVRCKDCKYSIPNDGKLIEGARYCSLKFDRASLSFFDVWDNDFCSYAVERKKDETTTNEDA